jgi:cytoskeletal protein RodZ
MQSFGSTIQAMRIRRGRTLDELSVRTRIPRRILESLESNQFDQLPAPVYTKGFIRSVCRELGYDATDAIQLYEGSLYARSGTTEPKSSMLVLSSETASHEVGAHGGSGGSGLRLAHALLLLAAALTFLAAILSAALREDSVAQRPNASIRIQDPAAASAPASSRR